jgi:hypothetical protein
MVQATFVENPVVVARRRAGRCPRARTPRSPTPRSRRCSRLSGPPGAWRPRVGVQASVMGGRLHGTSAAAGRVVGSGAHATIWIMDAGPRGSGAGVPGPAAPCRACRRGHQVGSTEPERVHVPFPPSAQSPLEVQVLVTGIDVEREGHVHPVRCPVGVAARGPRAGRSCHRPQVSGSVDRSPTSSIAGGTAPLPSGSRRARCPCRYRRQALSDRAGLPDPRPSIPVPRPRVAGSRLPFASRSGSVAAAFPLDQTSRRWPIVPDDRAVERHESCNKGDRSTPTRETGR